MFRVRPISAALLTAALLPGVLVWPALGAQTNGKHMPRGQKHSYEKEVEKLESDWRRAQLDGDAQVMDRMLAEDYIGITSTGLVVTKQEQLERVRTRTRVLTRMDVSDMKVKLIGSTAIVTSRVNAEGTNENGPIDGMYRYTRVYRRLPNGTWKIVNFEATRIPQTSSANRHEHLPAAP